MKNIPPVIKWTGSKRHQADWLNSLLPIGNTYFEPFIGGGHVLIRRKESDRFAGDILFELIGLYREIRDTPTTVYNHYKQLHTEFNSLSDLDARKNYFTAVRTRFNLTKDPLDFLFLTRTCINGLIRYNSKGEFNSSCHFTRPGIHPDKLYKILLAWSQGLKGVFFCNADYREVLTKCRAGDSVFLDPPYLRTTQQYSRASASFNFEDFWKELDRLNSLGVNWVLTLDGDSQISTDLYKSCLLTPNSKQYSTFLKVQDGVLAAVRDKVYCNFEIDKNGLL